MDVSRRANALREGDSKQALKVTTAERKKEDADNAKRKEFVRSACAESIEECSATLRKIKLQLTDCESEKCGELNDLERLASRLHEHLMSEERIRDRERRDAERKASEKEAQERHRALLSAAREGLGNPEELSIVLSAMVCFSKQQLIDLRSQLAREKQIASTSGVVNLGEQRAIGESIQEEQEDMAQAMRLLSKRQLGTKACSRVKETVDCFISRSCSDAESVRLAMRSSCRDNECLPSP